MPHALRRPPSPATLIALTALMIALGGTALGGDATPARETAAAGKVGNVKIVKTTFTVSNGGVAEGAAKCPAGTRIFSGGFASNGQHARILFAGPARAGNAYIGGAFTPPVNISAGVTSETATITLVGYCAPVGKAVVFR